MSFEITKKLKSLNTDPGTLATLSYTNGTNVFLMNEDEVETAIYETDVVAQFADLVATPGLNVTTRFGKNIIQELRAGGFLEEYERGGPFSFSDFICETIQEHFWDFDFIDSTIEKYDHKRGICNLHAVVQAPVSELIESSAYLSSWTVSVTTDKGDLTLS